ncbi:hypothetical protein DL769_000589 [Monosporascus sp. CRB-8-3]|nr:hypothetical protein DL769_000589 [Monosporascus sp. CRB-8-3]
MTELKLDTLITEVFEMIVSHLCDSDIAGLSRCNKTLQLRLESVLYGSEERSNKAMLWACSNGVPNVVKRAAAYGVHVSAPIEFLWRNGTRDEFRMLSLRLAAKSGHRDTFKLLLELGARVEFPDQSFEIHGQTKNLLKRICQPRNTHLLRLFLDSDAASRLKREIVADRCLTLVIKSGPSPDRVRALLEYGADPYRMQQTGGQSPCPVASCILRNALPELDLLLSKGADIHGKRFRRPRKQQIWHTPVFAAAWQMARHGVSMLQLCLDRGANINHCAYVVAKGTRRNRGFYSRYQHFTPMPVYVYLDSIENWDAGQTLPPTQGMKYWLIHGVVVTEGRAVHDGENCTCGQVTVSSMVNFLIDKWGLAQLREDEFFDTVKLLAQTGMGYRDRRNLRNEHDESFRNQPHVIQRRWERILEILTPKEKRS